MLNPYKSPEKYHQEIDNGAANEISVSEILFWKYLEYVPLILCNYKKLQRTKTVTFTISTFFSAQ